MAEKKIEEYVRTIPDFPKKGIMFRDVTSVLQDADGLHLAIDEMQKKTEGMDFDVIAGVESRGFIFGAPLAYNLHKPFVLVRKAGKLPCETVSQSYDLEYGQATIEMHKDAIKPGQKVLLVDDLILGFSEKLVEAVDEVHEAGDFFITDSNITRCLIRNMNFVSLRNESLHGTSHRDDIIVRMGREHDDTFGERRRALRTVGVIGIWLATWPARNGMLQVVEDLDVGIVG